jgi:hypothetical protein
MQPLLSRDMPCMAIKGRIELPLPPITELRIRRQNQPRSLTCPAATAVQCYGVSWMYFVTILSMEIPVTSEHLKT